MILCSISFYEEHLGRWLMSTRLNFNERILNFVFGPATVALSLLLRRTSAEIFDSAWWWVSDKRSTVIGVISHHIKCFHKITGITKIISNQSKLGSWPCGQTGKKNNNIWDQCKEHDLKPNTIQMSSTLYKCILIDFQNPAQQMQIMTLIRGNMFTIGSEIKA